MLSKNQLIKTKLKKNKNNLLRSRKRSKSSPNCIIDVLTSKVDSSSINNLNNSVHHSHYDLRKKKRNDHYESFAKSQDDNRSIEFTSNKSIRTTKSSPNLNETLRRKQIQKRCNLDQQEVLDQSSILINDLISFLPEEILLKIFNNLNEQDLCNVSSVSKKFHKISNDSELWKRLYKQRYEYDLPLIRKGEIDFTFIQNPNDYSNDEMSSNGCSNAWKFSFKNFYKSIHIRQSDSISKEILKIDQINSIFKSSNELNNKSNKLEDNQIPLLFLHPGTYKESFTIRNSVIMIGAAPGPINSIAKQVIIENCEKSTIHFTDRVKQTYLGYITVLFKLEENPCLHFIHQNHYAIHIDKRSKPKISNCIIRSSSEIGATICVSGESTEPIIKNCQISECKNVGIFVDEYARGFYEGNLIARNTLAGIWLKNYADPIFKHNTIKQGLDVGIFCFDNALGWFESNDISENRIAGVEVKCNSNPTFIKCKIHNGHTGGIYCHQQATGLFLENKIYNNAYSGIWITTNSNPTIRSNQIFNGMQGGIYVFGEGRGLIEKNDIFGNALAGIQVRSNSNPIIRHNRIYNGLHGGIYFHENALGLIEFNEISENALAAIWVTTASNPVIRSNRIHSGKQVGVYFYDNGNGILENNEIFNHLYSAIQIRSGSNPIIRKNKIWGAQNGGILVYQNGLSTIENNEIFSNCMANIWIKTESNPIIKNNKIFESKDCGICCFNNGKGLIENNNIFKNCQAGVLISSNSNAILKSNRIHSNLSSGIEITNNATATLKYNQIYNNRYGGISLASDVKPILKNNKVFDNQNIIEEAIKAGQCLYKISSYTSFPMHDFYRCLTCKNDSKNAICASCIARCHLNHDVQYIRLDRFFCDCGSGSLVEKCKLIETTQETDTIYTSASPIESKLQNN